MRTAYLIDPFAETITKVETEGTLREIYALLGVDCFDAVALGDGDFAYVDDEGLYRDGQRFFVIGPKGYVLAGCALIVSTDEHGETASPKMTIEQLRSSVVFVGDDPDFVPPKPGFTVTEWS